jgi:hypothetical protein
MVGLMLILCGCASVRSTTKQATAKDGTVTVTTSVRAYTLFDSQSQLTKFANRGTMTQSNQWAPGTTIGQLNQESSSTNLNAIIGTVVEAAVTAAKKP